MSAPGKALLGAVLALSVAAMGACGLFGPGGAVPAPGLPPDASTAQIDADQVVTMLDAGWRYAGTACLAAETSGALASGSCKKVLVPAENAIQAAAAAVDAWNAGASGNFPCLAVDALQMLVDVDALLQTAHVAVPNQLTLALGLADALVPACPATAVPDGAVLAPPIIVGHATDAGGQ